MYRMAMMALVTEDKSLNKDRCIRLALVHDMAECIVGDIAPADNISKEEKHRREEEYENQCTAEAKFVKQLDQCEMILQAFEYEELENTPGRLQDFYDSTAGKGPGLIICKKNLPPPMSFSQSVHIPIDPTPSGSRCHDSNI
ncbi:HD domain-containing protein 2 [Pitangus sulphuratus]|nr:HD domain-containing protein 2 [Pitangus sulphuratus]